MLMALTLIFVSLTMLVPAVEIVIQNNATTVLHNKVNATELIRFHTEMVSFCNNNPSECNKSSFVDFDASNGYSKFLIPELLSSYMQNKIHCYAEGNRFFTRIEQIGSSPEAVVDYNQLAKSITQYSPSYMGIGRYHADKEKYYITFQDGSKMYLTDEDDKVHKKLHEDDIVMVS